jgi:hypothetical protein
MTMTLTLPDMATPAQPPSDDRFWAFVLVTLGAEVALLIMWAAAVAHGANF